MTHLSFFFTNTILPSCVVVTVVASKKRETKHTIGMAEQDVKRSRTETTTSALTQLKGITSVVADTGEIQLIEAYAPEDATTNPSLIFKAAGLDQYQNLVDDAVEYALKHHDGSNSSAPVIDLAMDRLAVNFGAEISKLVPGYVSTEVDARLSFDTDATVLRARRIIDMYEQLKVPRSRILIKIASTFEGIRAGEILEKEGIRCNLTLLFSIVQAAACAEANITLISPFVGRILDWHKAKTGKSYLPHEDPGVVSVTNIYNYMRHFQYKTIVMGASFRNVDEILQLAGCDKLTIAPSLLQELQTSTVEVARKLTPPTEEQRKQQQGSLNKIAVDEASFRFALNEDQMATEKLSEGIRGFSSDLRKLEEIVLKKLNARKQH